MKKIFRITICCLGLFFAKTGFGQTLNHISSYKQAIELLIENKEYDSILAYSVHLSFPPPPRPTVEGLNNQQHYDDAFLLCFKNDSCFAICIAEYDSGFATSNRILIQAKSEIDSIRLSWTKAQNEYFLPFVYKHVEDKKARNDTLIPLHPLNGNLAFATRNYYESRDFLPLVTEETVSDYKNINYQHNSSLMLFSVFNIMERLYTMLSKQFIYHKT